MNGDCGGRRLEDGRELPEGSEWVSTKYDSAGLASGEPASSSLKPMTGDGLGRDSVAGGCAGEEIAGFRPNLGRSKASADGNSPTKSAFSPDVVDDPRVVEDEDDTECANEGVKSLLGSFESARSNGFMA